MTLSSLDVPAGTTLDLSKLADGTTVIFEGTTTFGFKEWEGPLLSIGGNKIVVKGAAGSSLDGQGALYWDGKGDNGKVKPKFFAAHSLTGSSISNILIKNPPVQVVSINGCDGLTITDMTIDASAGDKGALGHNTDGFDIGSSNNIVIDGAKVFNQDDCVAINSGTNITFKNGICSGGHGLSIGSVGGRSDNVVDTVTFSNSQVTKSTNGIRVKARSGQTGKINKVTYSGITLSQISKYGILIEQNYDGGDLHGTAGTGIPITGLTLQNISGTGAVASSGFDVVVTCGSSTSCTGWTWSGVSVTGGKTYGSCTNALSYVWGLSENPDSIYIGDCRSEVTPNLHAALLHLRDTSFARILWIDALCINQKDDDEKSGQIQLMAQIYAVAKEVVVWLGEEADDSSTAFEAIRDANLRPISSTEHKEVETTEASEEYFSRITNRFSSSVVETLLRHKRDDIKITERMMIDIARWCEPAVVDFALQEKEESMSLSEDIIVAAVENRDDDEVFHLMIASTWTKIEITDSVVKSAYDGGKSALKILLNQEKVIISITDEMLITSVRFLRPTVLALLLDHMEDKVEITEYVLVASLQRRFYRLDVIKLLLDRSGSNFEITSAILIAAVQHGEDALEITTLLLDYAGGRLKVGAKWEILNQCFVRRQDSENESESMALLLDHYGQQAKITEDILETVAHNKSEGRDIMELLFTRRGEEIVITERILVAAVVEYETLRKKKRHWPDVDEISIDISHTYLRDAPTVQEELFSANIRDGRRSSKESVLTLIITERGDELVKVLIAVAEHGDADTIMEHLLENYYESIEVTEAILRTVIKNIWYGYQTMQVLLSMKGDQICFTTEMIQEAVLNPGVGADVVLLLLNWKGNEGQITKAVLAVLPKLQKSSYMYQSLAACLLLRGPEFPFQEGLLMPYEHLAYGLLFGHRKHTACTSDTVSSPC
ncbi:endo-polygalacturonase precursor [Pyrenophora tritici-repentis]|nr:endo-polygalacturonase precursor [Pyrenophora tritici-repentis]KAI1574211.1 endo-polygalacturonase precursor [Pyrenophora tritici-repentis]KAI1673058.1 endo-polygalacturonase precursor [Pyrenophora tritici-repentis]PZD37313.1 endo-polygalacturonase precursor [Pyrenophora tritici-repentis]